MGTRWWYWNIWFVLSKKKLDISLYILQTKKKKNTHSFKLNITVIFSFTQIKKKKKRIRLGRKDCDLLTICWISFCAWIAISNKIRLSFFLSVLNPHRCSYHSEMFLCDWQSEQTLRTVDLICIWSGWSASV